MIQVVLLSGIVLTYEGTYNDQNRANFFTWLHDQFREQDGRVYGHVYLEKIHEVPEVSKVPEVPEVPKVPEVPEVPEVPKVPEVPEVHDGGMYRAFFDPLPTWTFEDLICDQNKHTDYACIQVVITHLIDFRDLSQAIRSSHIEKDLYEYDWFDLDAHEDQNDFTDRDTQGRVMGSYLWNVVRSRACVHKMILPDGSSVPMKTGHG